MDGAETDTLLRYEYAGTKYCRTKAEFEMKFACGGQLPHSCYNERNLTVGLARVRTYHCGFPLHVEIPVFVCPSHRPLLHAQSVLGEEVLVLKQNTPMHVTPRRAGNPCYFAVALR